MARRQRRRNSNGLRWVPLGFIGVAVVAVTLYLAGAGTWIKERIGGPLAKRTDETTEIQGSEGVPESSADSSQEPSIAPPASTTESGDVYTEQPLDGSPLDGSTTTTTAPAEPIPYPRAGRPARVAVVIDDLGRSVEDVRKLRALGVPLTYAVLPFETLTREVVAELQASDAEVLLHLPMEPANGANPGPGALVGSMSPGEMAAVTRRALDAVPNAVGVNNHMGSRVSADSESMNTILSEIGKRRLYFLDSRTSAASVGYKMAIDLGLPAAERHVFLDGDPSPEAIREQFRRLLQLASSRGSAIAIGHPYPETLAVLEQEVGAAAERGFQFVPVSYLLDRPDVLPQE